MFDGWEDVNLVGSEMSDPGRKIPRALIGGVAFVIVLFSLIKRRLFLRASIRRGGRLATHCIGCSRSFAGHGAASWITLAMIVSALGTLNSSVLSGARVDYAMARDGIFFRFAAAIHPRFRTPGNALIFQCCLASLMALRARLKI